MDPLVSSILTIAAFGVFLFLILLIPMPQQVKTAILALGLLGILVYAARTLLPLIR